MRWQEGTFTPLIGVKAHDIDTNTSAKAFSKVCTIICLFWKIKYIFVQ